MEVTVYSTPNCVQCTMTYRELEKKQVKYQSVNIREDAEALAKIKELGYLHAPVVIAGEEHWSGFQPDRIRSLVTQ